MNYFNEVKRLLDHEENISICSSDFFSKYCQKETFDLATCNKLQGVLDTLYPNKGLHGVYIETETLGAVLSIQYENEETNKKIPWGFIGIDHYYRPSLIPREGFILMFKGEYNSNRIREYQRGMSEYQAANFMRYLRTTLKPLMGTWLEFDWASDSKMNFSINYSEPKKKKDGTVVSGCLWYPEITDNEMHLVRGKGYRTKRENVREYKNADLG